MDFTITKDDVEAFMSQMYIVKNGLLPVHCKTEISEVKYTNSKKKRKLFIISTQTYPLFGLVYNVPINAQVM